MTGHYSERRCRVRMLPRAAPTEDVIGEGDAGAAVLAALRASPPAAHLRAHRRAVPTVLHPLAAAQPMGECLPHDPLLQRQMRRVAEPVDATFADHERLAISNTSSGVHTDRHSTTALDATHVIPGHVHVCRPFHCNVPTYTACANVLRVW